MRIRRVFLAAGLALSALVVALFGAVGTTGAAPATVFGPPTETSKVILADTSIDGPGLWTSPTGARVAWFKDPDGNILSISEHPENK